MSIANDNDTETDTTREYVTEYVTVVIDDQGATTLPAYGQIIVMVDRQRTVSPIDEAGNFYLENVPPGSYSAEVQYADGVCTLPIAVPAGSTALVNVGTIRCILPKKESK